MKNYLGEPAALQPSSFSRLRFRSIRHIRGGRFCAATISLAFLLFGCTKTKNQTLDEQTSLAIEQIDEENSKSKSVLQNDGSVLDYDLTTMNANMVYSQIFNLMLDPEEYENKTFKMRGNFIKFTDPEGNPAFGVIIKDALACCQQGLEFHYDFKKEPAEGQLITVTGKYTVTKVQNDMFYTYLEASSVEY
ncbi:hypothetical protein [Treponema pectinovorum]|uniref:hypothetical protein n=1 Tax=Treponema pectinovorum TaxID=164 RepID=UPI0011CC89E5|nr:hypothetical protein [Treponema pectinovorum]